MTTPNGNGHSEGLPKDLVEQIAKKAGPGAVFGDPIVHGQVAVIPVASVKYGGGGGAGSGGGEDVEVASDGSIAPDAGFGEGSGYGFGVQASPVGTIEVSSEGVVYQPVVDYSRLATIWSWISGVALIVLVVGMVFGGRRD